MASDNSRVCMPNANNASRTLILPHPLDAKWYVALVADTMNQLTNYVQESAGVAELPKLPFGYVC